jgi:hypothetical protein
VTPTGLSYQKYLVAFSLILVIALTSYSNSFFASWHLDDFDNILENPNVRLEKFTVEGINKAASGINTAPTFRPLAYLSFALNYWADGYNVFGYHVINFTIHCITAFILFSFIFQTVILLRQHLGSEDEAYSVALIATIMWAIHPIQVSAVTYIVQRMAVLVAMFYILSMVFYLLARTSQQPWKQCGFYFLCVLSATAAIATKQNAYMLPVSILLYEFILIRQVRSWCLKPLIKKLLPLVAILCMLGIVYAASYVIHSAEAYKIRPFTAWQRLLTESRVIVYYASLLLYPVTSRLTSLHDMELSTSVLHPWTTLPSLLLLLAALIFCVLNARKYPLVSFCILFFLINHAIEGTFIGLEIIFEHRNYLPSMLFFVPVALVIVGFLDHYYKIGKLPKGIVGIAVAFVFITEGIGTYTYNDIFKTEISLWADNVQKSPLLHRPLHNLAISLMKQGYIVEGCTALKRSIALRADARKDQKAQTYFFLGQCDRVNGHLDTAYENYLKAAEVGEKYADPYQLMAQMKERSGDLNAAESLICKALTIDHSIALYHLDYARILLKKGKPSLARIEARKALRLGGAQQDAYTLIAKSFRAQNANDAAEHFEYLAVGVSPQNTAREPSDQDKNIDGQGGKRKP